MATDQETFTDIDWEQEEVDASFLRAETIAELGAFAAVALLFVYDYFILANESPTIGNWDVLSVEWMFMLTVIALVFHLVLPLYKNPRLRGFYWTRFKKNKVAVGALGFLIFIFSVGIIGPLVIPPPETQFVNRIQPPMGITAVVDGVEKTGTAKYPFGSTAEGRGLFKLVIYGMRVSMEVGLIATVFATTIGSIVGGTAALATATGRGMIDEVLMRYVDIQSTFPVFMLLLLIIYLFGAKLWLIIGLYGVFGWEGVARTVRGEALQRAEEPYIKAAEASGADMFYVLRQHLLPNSMNSIIITASVLVPGFILGEAALAFLGFSDPTTFSWGRTIAAGQANLADAWWISTIPGVFLFFTVLSFYYVGEALRDAMDPRQEVGEGGL